MTDADNSPLEPVNVLPVAMSPRLMQEIARKYPAEIICRHIDSLLEATVGDPPRPDCRSVESALKLVLAYSIGLPVQRQEIVTHKITSAPSMDKLLENPATVEALWRQVMSTEAGKAMIKRLSEGTISDE